MGIIVTICFTVLTSIIYITERLLIPQKEVIREFIAEDGVPDNYQSVPDQIPEDVETFTDGISFGSDALHTANAELDARQAQLIKDLEEAKAGILYDLDPQTISTQYIPKPKFEVAD